MEIKEKISFEFNGNLYFTKQEAIKAQARYELERIIDIKYETDLANLDLDCKDDLNFLWQVGNLASKIIGYDSTKMIVDSLEQDELQSLAQDKTRESFSRGYVTALADMEREFNKSLFENDLI